MQAAPETKLQTQHYMSLATKTLDLSGTASTAWMLVQLHKLEVIPFYSLPSASGTGRSPTSTDRDDLQNSAAAAACEAESHATMTWINLEGLSTQMAVAVVLSWAAQLAQSGKAALATVTGVVFVVGVCALCHEDGE